MSNHLTFVIDSREQRPLVLESSIRRKLLAGDYSVLGKEDRIAVERKSLNDLTGSITRGFKRFRRELILLSAMNRPDVGGHLGSAAIAIESSLTHLNAHRYQSTMRPEAVLAKIARLESDFGVPFVWCEDRAKCAEWVRNFLERAARFATDESRMGQADPNLPS